MRRGEENRKRVMGKLTPTLRDMEADGRERRKADHRHHCWYVPSAPSWCVSIFRGTVPLVSQESTLSAVYSQR